MTRDDYPIPADHAVIWLGDDGNLRVLWRDETRGHTTKIPLTEVGLFLLRRILAARNRGETKVGEEGSPTQHQIDHWLAHNTGPKITDVRDRITNLTLSEQLAKLRKEK